MIDWVFPNRLIEKGYVVVGDMRHWVHVRGLNKDKPILIYLHGGPGVAMGRLFERGFPVLEENFVVVNWDQRYAGRSLFYNVPTEESMKLDVFVSDLKAIVEHFKRKYDRKKVYILGESWGSLLGMKYAQKHPDDLFAFIGTGQIVKVQDSIRMCYDFVRKGFEKIGCDLTLHKLDGLFKDEHPTVDDAKALTNYYAELQEFFVYRWSWLQVLRASGGYRSFFGSPSVGKYGSGIRTIWSAIGIFRGYKMSMKLLWDEIYKTDLFKEIPELKIPVYFLLGRNDNFASSTLAEQYLNQLRAPKKRVVWFENSDHTPLFDDRFNFVNAVVSVTKQ